MSAVRLAEQARKIERLEAENRQLRENASNREEDLYGRMSLLLDQLDITIAAWNATEKAMRERAEQVTSPLLEAQWTAAINRLTDCRDRIQTLIERHEIRPQLTAAEHKAKATEQMRERLGL